MRLQLADVASQQLLDDAFSPAAVAPRAVDEAFSTAAWSVTCFRAQMIGNKSVWKRLCVRKMLQLFDVASQRLLDNAFPPGVVAPQAVG